MSDRRENKAGQLIMLLLVTCIMSACGMFSDEGPELSDLPAYPGAELGETMEQSLPGGFMGGELVQYSSTDGFVEVEKFYKEALGQYNPEAMSHTSELGRQTALTIKKKYGLLTVAIQELTDEDKVTITFMAAGM